MIKNRSDKLQNKLQKRKKEALHLLIVGWVKFPYGSASASRIRTLAKGLLENGATVRLLSTSRILYREEDADDSGKMMVFEDISYESTNQKEIPGQKWKPHQRLYNHLTAVVRSWKRSSQMIKARECNAVYIYGRSLWSNAPIVFSARLAGVPVYFDICEWYPTHRFFGGFFNLRYLDDYLGRQLPRFTGNGVIAITSYIKEKYDRHNVPCILIPSLYDFRTPPPKGQSRPLRDVSEFSVVYAGTCKNSDGVDVLLDAVRSAKHKGCPVHLSMVGTDGKTGDALKYYQICQQDRLLRHCVIFRGRLTENEYHQTLAQADCLVLPRPDVQINRAAFPTRLPEFLATGRPVLTTDVPDVPLYLKADVHAEIVSASGGSEALADGIVRLWQSPERAKKLGRDGLQRCLEVFDYRAHTKRLFESISTIQK